MVEITGTVVLVQEGRLHVIDAAGDGHLLILSPSAQAETGQLRALAKAQSRIRVQCETIPNLVALKAERIEVLGEGAPA